MNYEEWRSTIRVTYCASLSEEERKQYEAETELLLREEYAKILADPSYKFTGAEILNRETEARIQEILDEQKAQ